MDLLASYVVNLVIMADFKLTIQTSAWRDSEKYKNGESA
jgi:hypothetical protein